MLQSIRSNQPARARHTRPAEHSRSLRSVQIELGAAQDGVDIVPFLVDGGRKGGPHLALDAELAVIEHGAGISGEHIAGGIWRIAGC